MTADHPPPLNETKHNSNQLEKMSTDSLESKTQNSHVIATRVTANDRPR